MSFSLTPVSGNLLVLVGTGDSTFNAISGWTKNVTLVIACETTIWSKVSNGTETSVTASMATADCCCLAMFEFAGVSVLDQAASSSANSSTTTLVPTKTTLTTTGTNDVIVAMVGVDQPNLGTNSIGPIISWDNSTGSVASATSGFMTNVYLTSKVATTGAQRNVDMGIAVTKATSAGTFGTTATLSKLQSVANSNNGMIACYR
jgi:hypothetical protein